MRGFGDLYKHKKKIQKKNKPDKEQRINHAIHLHLKGNIAEASKYYQQLIRQECNDQRVYSNYGAILQGLGKIEEAEVAYSKAIELNPNFANAYSNLGSILRDRGKLQEAEVAYRKAIELNPNFANAYSNLGNILSDLGKLKEAEVAYRKAIELNPNFANAYSNLGNILSDLGKLKEAEVAYRKAIELNPDFADAYFNLFSQYEKINNLKKLKETLKEFNKIDTIKNELLLFRSRLSFRNKAYQTSKELIDSISSKWIEKLNKTHNRIFWSYKAFIEDKVGNYDIAYSCFEKSQDNSLYLRFSKDSSLNLIDLYKKSITHKKISYFEFNDGIEDSNLAFLIGFPRSGTTLLDTVLRSHKDIEVIEEQPILSAIENLLQTNFDTKPDNLYNISEKIIKILRQNYFELLKEYTNTKGKLIIDKMPLNTIRLPLINLLFPNAKIIFAHRHPYDTVLSCFQQSFKPNSAMANLVSLKSSSIMYDRTMNAWDIYKKNLPLDFITSKYEHFIEEFNDHTLKILEFLGIGWDENVKNYRKTALKRSMINTPSSSQVVQPLYKSSIEKWKNYEKYFEDCHQYLEKWVTYFNY